jgi:hypothetical protein
VVIATIADGLLDRQTEIVRNQQLLHTQQILVVVVLQFVEEVLLNMEVVKDQFDANQPALHPSQDHQQCKQNDQILLQHDQLADLVHRLLLLEQTNHQDHNRKPIEFQEQLMQKNHQKVQMRLMYLPESKTLMPKHEVLVLSRFESNTIDLQKDRNKKNHQNSDLGLALRKPKVVSSVKHSHAQNAVEDFLVIQSSAIASLEYQTPRDHQKLFLHLHLRKQPTVLHTRQVNIQTAEVENLVDLTTAKYRPEATKERSSPAHHPSVHQKDKHHAAVPPSLEREEAVDLAFHQLAIEVHHQMNISLKDALVEHP